MRHDQFLGKSLRSWPVQQLPAKHNPWPWRAQEGGCSPFTLHFLKGTGKTEWLCHQRYELDLSGLVPDLFTNGGRSPVSCFPGAILNSQPFVPRHHPGASASAPAPLQMGWHQAFFFAGQDRDRQQLAEIQLSVSPLLVLAQRAGAFQVNSCVSCCLMGTPSLCQYRGGRDRGDLPALQLQSVALPASFTHKEVMDRLLHSCTCTSAL